MAFSAPSRLAGFLRRFIGRPDDRATARSVFSTPPAPAPPPVPASRPAPSRPANPDEIEIPLASVLANLPLELKSKLSVAPPADRTLLLSAEIVIGQLAFGAVKISFGELRKLAPGVFINSGGELDNKLVSLPLQEILPRLNPALLARHATKRVEVGDEIVGPFAGRGRGLSFTTQPLKASLAAAPGPAPEPVDQVLVPPVSNRHVPVSSAPPAVTQRSITPAPPLNGLTSNGHGHSLPVPPLSARPLTPSSNGVGAHGNGHGLPPTPGLRLGPLNGNVHGDTLGHLKMSAAPTADSPAPAAAHPAPSSASIFVGLVDLCGSWPEGIKEEILRTSLAQAHVYLDSAFIIPGLKRGRVLMPWKQLRLLAQPGSAPSVNDAVELELPLKVIAPLFIAAQKSPPRPMAKVSADIPDLFFGFPQAVPPPTPLVVAPVPAAPVPAAARVGASVAPEAPVVRPLPKSLEAKPVDQKGAETNFYVWGAKGEAPQVEDLAPRHSDVPQTDFMSRVAHPKDVVAQAVALPGVAGSVVAMQDGLRVASQVPTDLSADTLAAFLPQIFERLNQSTRELRMGALNNVSFTVGNVPWKIFRVNAVYFAAFGLAGEQLPTAQLAQLAGQLDRKKQR